jgi:hypothetical protein
MRSTAERLALPVEPLSVERFLAMVRAAGDDELKALLWSGCARVPCGDCRWHLAKVHEPCSYLRNRTISEHCCHPGHARRGLPHQHIKSYRDGNPAALRPGWCPELAPNGQAWPDFLRAVERHYAGTVPAEGKR